MAIGKESLEKIFDVNVSRWKTSISWIEEDFIVTRGYFQEDLIGNVSFADVVFLLLKGDLPSKDESKMLDAILVSFCDHGVTPPSTQIARLAASTGSPLHASAAAGLLAFGREHAGAIQDCMKLLQEAIKDDCKVSQLAREIVDDYLEKDEKIPGFGHRYHSRDPRAARILELARKYKCMGRHAQLALEIEKVLNRLKNINMNIDGANAAILSDLGFHWEIGTGMFMIGRLAGLIAHINEERREEKPFRKTLNLGDIEYHGRKPDRITRR